MTYRSHDPEAEADNRDWPDLPRDERRAVLHGMSSLDLIAIVEEAIDAVQIMRDEIAALRATLGQREAQ